MRDDRRDLSWRFPSRTLRGLLAGAALLIGPAAASAQQPPASAPGASAGQAATPAAAAQGPVQAPAAPAPKAPLPNRLNDVLPSWLRMRGEFRERLEGFDSLGYVNGRDDRYWLTRFRLNATVQPSAILAFTVQAQDARVADKTVGPTAVPFRDELDLRMAYVDVGNLKSPVAVRAGRQELVFGDQRLVGHLNWVNDARSFDGGRVSLRGKKIAVDAFAVSVVNITDEAFNTSAFDASQFYGAYASTTALVKKGTVEPYVFYRRGRNQRSETGALGDLTQVTFGARWVGTLPARLDYNVEMAGQTGSLGPDTIGAWAGHWQIRETVKPKRGLRLAAEYNAASGDKSPLDGKRGTFDQLYPTGHDKYGLADQVGWKNVHHVRAGAEVLAHKGLLVSGAYHSFWLAEAHDALYNAGSAVVARVPGGAASTHVGQELDAQATYTVSPQIQVAGGYAHVLPGAFLKQATPGASYSAPYAMVTYVFLAEK